MSSVIIEGSDGLLYNVELNTRSCDCEQFNRTRACPHLDLASDIYLSRGQKFRWETYSAFHKSVRRGDVASGVRWAKIFTQISSEKKVGEYSEKILFEETRNTDLLRKFRDKALPPNELARLLIRSVKKWEIPSLSTSFNEWLDSFERYQSRPAYWSEHTLSEAALRFQTLSEGYELSFAVAGNKNLKDIFWASIAKRANSEKNTALKDHLLISPHGNYARQLAVEMSLHLWREDEANSYHPDQAVEGDFIPVIPAPAATQNRPVVATQNRPTIFVDVIKKAAGRTIFPPTRRGKDERLETTRAFSIADIIAVRVDIPGD